VKAAHDAQSCAIATQTSSPASTSSRLRLAGLGIVD
jgi:hypothetical protein